VSPSGGAVGEEGARSYAAEQVHPATTSMQHPALPATLLARLRLPGDASLIQCTLRLRDGRELDHVYVRPSGAIAGRALRGSVTLISPLVGVLSADIVSVRVTGSVLGRLGLTRWASVTSD
jgi:hypothetical protein